MTSYCDVTNSAYPVTMTTIGLRHCSILEFGRGHPIKQSPRASLDLCTPLDDSIRVAAPYLLLLVRLLLFFLWTDEVLTYIRKTTSATQLITYSCSRLRQRLCAYSNPTTNTCKFATAQLVFADNQDTASYSFPAARREAKLILTFNKKKRSFIAILPQH